MQKTLHKSDGLHVAIMMDGNGRWATRQGMGRSDGHRAGAEAIRGVVERAPALGISMLTLFGFSSDNWRRPPAEVAALMRLIAAYLRHEAGRLAEHGIRLEVIGRRDRLPSRLNREIQRAIAATASGDRLTLRLAIDYSGRAAIVEAARAVAAAGPDYAERFGELVAGGRSAQELDLVIRTGGEQRLSDFLLWEAAYAELWFTEIMWPDFTGDDLDAAVAAFRRRDRRFGGLNGQAGARA
ncbi:MAG TPA: di-trans,poly-cis-decaprenylcistransferase [Stellaceae bacterium]|nr:di-trans,poly-cis-decaprenylcistransferase [Stellaceae bacterium]